jgi:hypothetical protein
MTERRIERLAWRQQRHHRSGGGPRTIIIRAGERMHCLCGTDRNDTQCDHTQGPVFHGGAPALPPEKTLSIKTGSRARPVLAGITRTAPSGVSEHGVDAEPSFTHSNRCRVRLMMKAAGTPITAPTKP